MDADGKAPKGRFRVGKVFRFMVAVLFTGLAIEFGAILVSKAYGLPLTAGQSLTSALSSTTFWSGTHTTFGEWHPANRVLQHRSACFDVRYETNSYGARDRDRSRDASAPRVLVMGDSFMEGWGVDTSDRLSDRLEAETGLEHLNFASSGELGSTTELLIYRDLASQFDHDGVILAVLPENDFEDNDLEFGQIFHEDRYRPYFVPDSAGYHLVFHNESVRDHPRLYRSLRYAKAFARNVSFTYRLTSYLRAVDVYESNRLESGVASGPLSRYYDFPDDAWALMSFGIRELARQAAPRPLLILSLPTRQDIERFRIGPPPPLPDSLAALASEVGASYIDLLPPFVDAGLPHEDLFLWCDGHWTAQGHALAASLVAESDFYRQVTPSDPPPTG